MIVRAAEERLTSHGITSPGRVYWNLETPELIRIALEAREGVLTKSGALVCNTGEHTGRSPSDKFIVEDRITKSQVWWGSVNQPMSEAHFAALRRDQLAYLQGKTLFARDAFGGADRKYRLPITVINEQAWANLFCKQLFIRPTAAELKDFQPKFTIIHTPHFKANPAVHGTKSETFIVLHFTENLALIGGTSYAGEMKKSIFSLLNYLYPLQGVLSMHCSANVSKRDAADTALFFGLSGTGKTTLSADPGRRLIGDDEHGWTDRGIFNFEGGCYAKCIKLSKEREPQIWNAIRDGAVLENVVLDPKTGEPNFDDASITENTRAAYPLDYIEDAVIEGTGAHPRTIIFLTCDAFGVMPPISRLTTDQAMYHFLSGYTAKVAGTEKGMGNTPKATFSACFGSPFLPLNPTVYADLLGKKMNQHEVQCWLVNTGWIGGGVGVGERIALPLTRRLVTAALSGELNRGEFRTEPFFNLAVPTSVEGVPNEILMPRTKWKNPADYDSMAKSLASQFVENFKKFESHASALVKAGPTA